MTRISRGMIAASIAVALGSASVALAQNPATVPVGQRGARGGRGGRRPTVAVMTLSTGWTDGGTIPVKYAQPGHEVSPPLTWSGTPDSTVSFVLMMHDVNAPMGNGLDDVLHWLVWDIPGSAKGLPEGYPQGPDQPDGTRQISVTGPYFRAPAAPASGPPHHYVFELFALDTTVAVPAVGAAPPATRAAVLAAMAGHVRGKAVAVGTYKRSP
jgi:Raf kinase inhibitor-like YbhB/YbcL family protein